MQVVTEEKYDRQHVYTGLSYFERKEGSVSTFANLLVLSGL